MLGAHHVALATPDLGRLRAFYAEVFGLRPVGGFPERGIVFLDAGGVRVEILEEPDAAGPSRRHHLALAVVDVDRAYAELTAQGVPFDSPPEDFPPEAPASRIAFARDPDGNVVELIEERRAFMSS